MKHSISDHDLSDFTAFLNIMAKRMTVQEPDDQLLDAFRVFDKEGKDVGPLATIICNDISCFVPCCHV